MRNKQYWIDRAERRMDGYVASAFDEARVIGRAYRSLKTYITAEMVKILRHTGGEDTLAYEYRMKRLNALLLNAEQKYKELYGINLNSATEFLKSIIPEAYYHTIYDIAHGIGEQPEFATVPTRLVNKIINEDWSGRNYSKRIWANTEDLAEELREVMTEAAVTGESIGKTSRKIADKFDTSEYNARRLIRTETTYACNQAELGAYKELDIDRYMYVATYAESTCEVCQKNNNKVFEQSKARAGVNLPPMHPNCRCTTIAYFDEGMPTVRIARDKDGKNIQIPANMSYDDWKAKYITPYKQENGTETASKGTGNRNTKGNNKANKTQNKASDSVSPAEIVVSKAEKPTNAYTEEKIQNLSIDFDDKSSIIKSIDIDDYNLVTYGKDIAPEVNDVIFNTMKKCEKEGGFVISEISPAVKPTSHGTPVLQIEPLPNGLVQLNVNTDYLSGKTLEEINRAFLDTDSTVVNSLEEAVIHESGHAISIKGKKGGEIENYYAMLKPLGKSGVSEIALSDGAECLAELEVLRHRKTKVSKELSDFYEKYMGRKYL